jgi:hypothetical protein
MDMRPPSPRELMIARMLMQMLETQPAAQGGPDTGSAAAWRGIAQCCEVIADHAYFLAERADHPMAPK